MAITANVGPTPVKVCHAIARPIATSFCFVTAGCCLSLLHLPSQNPLVIKAFFLLALAGGLIALILIVLGKFPVASS
jgi:uncharacterized membrane protein